MGGARNLREQLRPELGLELLGVVQTCEPAVFEEDNRRGNDGAGERATPGFIDASNKKNAPLLESALVPE